MTGPRQSGKTTLCRTTFPDYVYVNLEDSAKRAFIAQDIQTFLLNHPNGLILDEAQLLPELFAALQVVVDEHKDYRYIISGSSDFLLMKNISESLAGRVAVLRLLPLSVSELGADACMPTDELMWRGFYPAVWGDKKDPVTVYDSYLSTYLLRDVRQLINVREISVFQRFLTLLAARVGTEFNANSLASELGVDGKTVTSWMGILETSYTAFRLQPFYRNIGKRLGKTPKVYFYDVGLVCFLIGIQQPEHLSIHPLRGQVFENMVVVERLKTRLNAGLRPNLFFYRDKLHEVDLLTEEPLGVNAYEIKSAVRYNPALADQLVYLKKTLGTELLTATLLYDGENLPAAGDILVRNWRR